ncbi:M48 family metallopeptidase [Pseudodesulfovibrio sp. zrk46]|uniref:M48 family metallopeptidase n=1 Tax=Pseudodesulfovibrio sp. zrk46 TaxID=2725288 RepID=UPI00144A2B60|nr:M48 family metallopeptidase [Pseudodesulfovibrio sp. zrk46]QJB57172.1 M48 family metalloprotease [Pseudodesulfovibrio sp. zrk46]
MKRRSFLRALFLTTPILLAPGLASAFEIGLPGGFKVDTEDIKNSYKAPPKKPAGYQEITPQQEHYLGRAVAASILTKYSPLQHDRAQKYLNVMGLALAKVSDRPETFGGYKFMILDTDEINAMSAPGGFIFVTKGMLRCCKTEDAMAAALAHEIAHVQRKHPLQALSKGVINQAARTQSLPGTSTFFLENEKNLAKTLGTGTETITTTLLENGYSTEFEEEADKDAVTILQRLGYDPNYFIEMLQVMKKRLAEEAAFAKTHPAPEDRIKTVESIIGAYRKTKPSVARKFRFMTMTGGM